MTSNDKFLRAVERHMPQVDIKRLRSRLASLCDLESRYFAACLDLEDAKLAGTTAMIAKASQDLKDLTNMRRTRAGN